VDWADVDQDRASGSSCEYGNEPSDSLKAEGFS
jgi:hypothetical protein